MVMFCKMFIKIYMFDSPLSQLLSVHNEFEYLGSYEGCGVSAIVHVLIVEPLPILDTQSLKNVKVYCKVPNFKAE